ncbi:MAG: DUF642 domain-containing protein, partial [Candidatus Competibacteraceae bacterium]|nr:DUF642 domain-containing protein [Candidatus Competibacteraceae bacterium]
MMSDPNGLLAEEKIVFCRQRALIPIILFIFINIFSFPAHADTFTVTTLNDSGPGSLRQAVLDANASVVATHTIEFQPGLAGTITLVNGEIAITGRITINGPGQNVLAISGNKTSPVFNVSSLGATIRGLMIKEGHAYSGGGISNTGYLTLGNLTLSDNESTYGGGIYNTGSLALSDIMLSDNKAVSGGGIYNSGLLSTATRLALIGNQAGGASGSVGGGILHSGSHPLLISDSTFTSNQASNAGGGVYSETGALTVTHSTFNGNWANHGGGISTSSGTTTITYSTFSGNEASEQGGAIYDQSTLTVTNSTLSGNASGQGGGINHYGTANITNSTVTDNMAINSGGGIQASNGTLNLRNSLVAGNTALTGQNLNTWGGLAGGSNLFGENGVSGVEGATPSPSAIIAGPLSSVIGPLADNGGPTQTHALVAGSSAINAGDNSLIPAGVTTDQRGDGFPRIVGGTVDIGAVEGTGGGAGNSTNLIVNGSFEEGNYYDAQGFQRLLPNDTALSGWLIGGSGADWHVGTPNPSQNPLFIGAHLGPAQDGSLIVDLNLDGESTGTLSQTFATNVGTTYTVSFYMAGVDLFTNPRAVQVTVNGVARTFSQTASPQYQLIWGLKSFEFTATQSETTLTFSSPDVSGVWGPLIDNVSVLLSNPSPVTYTLTVSKAGTGSGTVTSNPSGIDCGFDCSESFSANTMVTLTAKPDSFDVKPLSAGNQQVFAGWSGACTGTNPSCTVTMNAAKNVTATFTSSPTGGSHPLNVTLSGNGVGSVTSQPSGIACSNIPGDDADCSETYAANTQVTLTTTPGVGPHYFSGWSGACSGTGACTVTMNAAKSVTAAFATGYALTLTYNPEGSIARDPVGSNCTFASATGDLQCIY